MMKVSKRVQFVGGATCVMACVGVTVGSSVAGSVLTAGWDLGRWSVWAPWRLPGWWRLYSADQPLPFMSGALAGSLCFGLWVLCLRLYLLWSTPAVEAVGRGKWGRRADIKKAGLLQEQGVVVGRLRDDRGQSRDLLAYDGPEHQLVAGATRSGKGVGHVIPTLLNWRGSALVYDIKGELWQTTAGFRGRFGHVLRFAPTRGAESARFNPLMEIRSDHMVRDAQNLAQILVDPGGEKHTLDIWDQSAAQFLTALILHVLLTQPDDQKHLGRVREMLMDIEQTVDLMMRTRHLIDEQSGEAVVHPEIYRSARSLDQQSERFRSSVRGTAEGYLMLWADEGVVEATRCSDFCASDLMVGEHPLTLYIEPPPSDADRLRPLVRAMLYQISRALMEDLEHDNRGRKKRHKLLLTLDEFPTLGKLPFLADNLRQMAGYGLKAQLVVQSFEDIADAYGPHNTIIDNCHIVVAFASADTTSAKRISDMTGVVTEQRAAFSKRRMAPLDLRSRTQSVSEHVRPLLTPGEVRELPADRQLVFVNGVTPLLTSKVRYYEDPHFTARVSDPPVGPDLPVDSAVSQDWVGCRAYDVVSPDEDEAVRLPDDGGAEVFDTLDEPPPEVDPEVVLGVSPDVSADPASVEPEGDAPGDSPFDL